MKYIDSFKRFLTQKGKAKSTVIAYISDLTDFFNVIKKDVDKVSTEDLDLYKKKLKIENISNKTATRKLNSINSFYKWLVRNNIVSLNPVKEISYPKSLPQKQRILSDDEYRKILATARDNMRLFTMVSILLYTGMKISELADLKVGDINLDFKNPHIKINHDSRTIPLIDKALFLISSYLNESHEYKSEPGFPLFYTSRKKPIVVRNIRKMISEVFQDAEIYDVAVNDLRNTFVVKQLEAGNSINFVSNIVGNKSIEATERYLSLVKNYEVKGIDSVAEL